MTIYITPLVGSPLEGPADLTGWWGEVDQVTTGTMSVRVVGDRSGSKQVWPMKYQAAGVYCYRGVDYMVMGPLNPAVGDVAEVLRCRYVFDTRRSDGQI